jgi:hypothetical protein
MKKLYAYEHLEIVEYKQHYSVPDVYVDSAVSATKIIHFADIDIPSIKINGVKWDRAEEYDLVVGA